MFLWKCKEKLFLCKVLREGVFVNQLSSHAGISIGRMVYVKTNCCFVSDISLSDFTLPPVAQITFLQIPWVPKRPKYWNLLWVLSDWIPFFWQKAVFCVHVMRTGDIFANNYTEPPIILWQWSPNRSFTLLHPTITAKRLWPNYFLFNFHVELPLFWDRQAVSYICRVLSDTEAGEKSFSTNTLSRIAQHGKDFVPFSRQSNLTLSTLPLYHVTRVWICKLKRQKEASLGSAKHSSF